MPVLFNFDEGCETEATVAALAPAPAEPELSPREILARDFLGRDASFVHQRRSGRLGWEARLPEGSSFSEYVMDTSDAHALLRKAHRIARETLVAMELPSKVRIVVNHKEMDCTDSKTVFVSTNVFDSKELTPGQKADVFTGTAIHEGCHIKYTDFSVNGGRDRLLQDMLNVVEDERIERILGEELPGFANYLKVMKYWCFNLYEKAVAEALAAKGVPMVLSRVARLFNAILHLVRYPAALSDEDIDEFGETLVKVRDILSDWPSSTAEAMERSRRIVDLYREEAERQAARDGESDPDGRGGGNGNPDGNPEGRPSDGNSSEGNHDGDRNGRRRRELQDALERVAEMAAGLSRDPGRKPSADDESREVRNDRHVQEDLDGKLERGSEKDMTFVLPSVLGETDVERSWRESYERVRPYIPAVRRILQSNASELRLEERGHLSGRLDEAKLVEAVQGVPAVYRRRKESASAKVAVCILVDESGSMCGRHEGRTRAAWAKDAAILLNEGLKDVPNIDLYVYGHTADDPSFGAFTTQVVAYRDRMNRDRHALGARGARYDNTDGVAIREVARRVRAQTQAPCLMFVISDGAPASWQYSGSVDGVEDTRKAVQEVTRMGFTPVQIAIDAALDPSKMFDHYMKFTNLPELPKKLGAIITKAVLKTSGRKSV